MVDPNAIVQATKAALGVADKLVDWYVKEWEAAQTKEQQDAVELVYSAAVLAASIAALDGELRTLRDSIGKLDNTWGAQQRIALADEVRDLGRRERYLRAIKEKTAFLQVRVGKPNWRTRIPHPGKHDPVLDDAINNLVDIGKKVLEVIGANINFPTPTSIGYLEVQIREHADAQEVRQTADHVLDVIDLQTTRSVAEALGGFAGRVSKKHGIPTPDWSSGVVHKR